MSIGANRVAELTVFAMPVAATCKYTFRGAKEEHKQSIRGAKDLHRRSIREE